MSVETGMNELSPADAAYIERVLPPRQGPGLHERFETSHTERWEITFQATVPAGLEARRRSYTAEHIIRERMTEVLMQAGVRDPRVEVRKIGRCTHRGMWEPGVEYEPGETVEWHGSYWVANQRSCNRKPDGIRSGDSWGPTTYIQDAADPFFTVVVDQAIAELPPTHSPEYEGNFTVDDDIVDAEIVE